MAHYSLSWLPNLCVLSDRFEKRRINFKMVRKLAAISTSTRLSNHKRRCRQNGHQRSAFQPEKVLQRVCNDQYGKETCVHSCLIFDLSLFQEGKAEGRK